MLLTFLTAVGAFIVGLTARFMGQRLNRPWIVTIVLALPLVIYAYIFLTGAHTQAVKESLLWAAALAGGGVVSELAFRGN